MKKFFLFGLTALFALTGCEKDFEVTAPYKDVTLVYGIINQLDTAHYVRIQKAFLDENKSAIEMSKNADSSYFPNLVVKMQEYQDQGSSENLLNEIALDKVNLADEGYPKEAAANSQGFFQSPSYAYKFKWNLNPLLKYRLIIHNPNSGKNDTSEFLKIVNSDSSRGAGRFYIRDFVNANYTLDFAKTSLPAHEFSLTGTTPLNAGKIEGMIRFRWVERNVVDGSEVPRSADMYIPAALNTSYLGTQSYILKTHNKTFYTFLRDAIGLPAANTERYIDKCDVWVFAGSQELYMYEQINQAQSGGLTADQIKPHFTNMKSKDAIGILASKSYRLFEKAAISDITLDSLMKNEVTAPLNIKGKVQ